MIGNASKTPTPRKRNVKMFGRCLGLTGYRSTALLATIPVRRSPSRTRTAATMMPKREEGEGCNQRFRAQESTFRRMLVIVRDR